MARHRHAVNVREDGLAAVLGPLLRDSRVVAATLVDVDSGMVLDAWAAAPDGAPDLELLGAQHAEVVRGAFALLRGWPRPGGAAEACEVVLASEGGFRHLLRTVPDPHGDRLALSVVVNGPPRVLDHVSKRLRSVAVDALTAGPTMSRRPVLGVWRFAMPGPDVPATAGVPAPGPGPSPGPAPPVAVPPVPTSPVAGPPVPVPPISMSRAPAHPPSGPIRPSGGGRVEMPGPRDGRPAPQGERRPSPPAALPAPFRPVADTAAGPPLGTA